MRSEQPVDTTSDSELLDQLRCGDADGLSRLYGRYHERVLRYCLNLMNGRRQAEDIAQDVFLKLHAQRHTIRNGQTLQSWLFTVARNAALTELGKHAAALLDESVVCGDASPADRLMTKERAEIIESVLHRLSIPYREAIVLRFYEHLSYEEIACITGTTVSSVKSRLFKARKALVTVLKPYFSSREL